MKPKIKTRIWAILLILISIFSIIPTIPVMATELTDGGWNITLTATNVVDINGTIVGYLNSYEGITILDYHPNYSGMVKVEYSSSSSSTGYQRGYIPYSAVLDEFSAPSSNVARVTSSATTYYTPSTAFYAGSVSTNEYVVVFRIKNGWAYIEYNAGSGYRKRAYVPSSNLYVYPKTFNNYGNSFYQDGLVMDHPTSSTSYTTVYSGPGQYYSTVGLIYPNDAGYVKSYCSWTYGSTTWYYVSYPVENSVKYGYINY